MTRFFADAAYVVGLNNPKDQHHADALRVQRDISNAGHLTRSRDLFVSDLVVIEFTQELLAHCGFTVARQVLRQVERNHTVLRSKPEDCSQGFYELCSKYGSTKDRRGLGVVDSVSVLLMRRNKLGLILSTDTAFDRVPALRRIWIHNLEELLGF